jgi:ABC-2 type transport system permease protein
MWLTLRLNFRSKQAVVYGFVFPLLFLFAFWGIYYKKEIPPLANELGQLLTVTILSGACFGMPTAMVSERERGVWRRYRLLPSATGGIVLSAMVVRVVLVAIAIVMQLVLAHYVCGAAWPARPFLLAGVFFFVAFAFLGLGLVIAMLADNVPAVQALGQIVFLPMLMIGGIGVRLDQLPNWAAHIAAFLPGVYSVDALDAALRPRPLSSAIPLSYCLFALTIIGAAGCLTGRQMFRWDAAQKMTGRSRAWVTAALAAWLAVGVLAEEGGKVKSRHFATLASTAQPTTTKAAATQVARVVPPPTTSAPATQQVAETPPPTSMPTSKPTVAGTAPWVAITDADIDKITYDDLQPDTGTVTPVAANLDNLDDDGKKQMEEFTAKLDDWPPGKDLDIVQRVRNLLSICAIADLLEDQYESYIPYIVFDHIRYDVGDPVKLKKVLAYIVYHPDLGHVLVKAPEFGFDQGVFEEGVRDRSADYARKMLARELGKVPQQ